MMDIEKKYVLSTKCMYSGLQVTLKDCKTNQSLQCLITNQIQQLKVVNQWFYSFSDLAQHLSHQSGYEFEPQSKKLKILVKHPTRPLKMIQAMVFNMKQKDQKNSGNCKDIDKIIQLCQSQKQISNLELRKMVLSLAYAARSLHHNNQQKLSLNNQQQIKRICIEQFHKQMTQNKISPNFPQPPQKYPNQKISQLLQQSKNQDQVIDAVIKKIQNISKDIDIRIDKMQDRVEACQEQLKGSLNKILSAQTFLDQNCFSAKRVIIHGNQIVKLKDSEADVFSKIKIKNKKEFSIRVDSVKQWMCIGVADSALKGRESFSNQANCVAYYNDGNFYNGATLSGRKYKIYEEGDIIHVSVDLEIGKINWVIDNQLRISYVYDKIRDKNIQWVPYIWLYSNGDQISIIK